MLIDQTFLDNLDLKLAEGGQGFHLAPRLTGATNRFQTKSSFSRLRKLLNERLNQDIGWDEVRAEIREIPIAKQQKYSAAVKFIEKSFLEQGSKMFETLRRYGTKLSKSQQRYTIPMVEGDAGHGLCGEMAILWLKEQLSSVTFRSDFQRIADGNVVASNSALRATRAAMALQTTSSTNAAVQPTPSIFKWAHPSV
ncbi:hypothetical protein C8R34_11922 [Nitrosomonas sp. Nm84]|uniref:hypothetical protein n=1 Tax=Nitrosomonas sp. Nm84 TaxID=200124 RepID=UPI000D76918F|nr:hypothetical protein [Nitrosomonas sp. Nm84]PXW85470.1 hypothetical protein C8R34_11922 [Nitrosomonas sp. Nm84]